jgi:hypothetical protein
VTAAFYGGRSDSSAIQVPWLHALEIKRQQPTYAIEVAANYKTFPKCLPRRGGIGPETRALSKLTSTGWRKRKPARRYGRATSSPMGALNGFHGSASVALDQVEPQVMNCRVNAFLGVTDRTRARRVGLVPSSRQSEQTWWGRPDRRRA